MDPKLLNFTMFNYCFIAFFLLVASCLGQRPSYAGRNPIGYPSLETTTSSSADGLGNRFGNDDGTTQRLPLEALGDRDLVNRLNKLPIDKQPFWFLNWKALEEFATPG
ncbi:unnamed protein product [Parnassius apollo]|uniref:(apollo) hypothetical protein n=1 Tax=Parnassius apollo TaxID=110799 RepID=A0A8S3XKN1_PARAO|nr:unnamed protein product [Parnassius apollo]